MALHDLAAVLGALKHAVSFSAGNIGYYLAAAGLAILVVAGLFIGGMLVYRGLKNISYMETGEFAKFLLVSAIVLIVLGAIWP
ncbi:MAG: hypothetical protein GSR73_02695 [Desulfurococcales archaeon]|nr:hypothetical protein [Desulfurococcales archaeon]